MSSFAPHIKNFIEQAIRGTSQNTGSYPKEYHGLSVAVSFGHGSFARIPWMSFTGYGQTTREGIYPVLLFYKPYNTIILAYGVSETSRPFSHWNIAQLQRIEDFFNSNGIEFNLRYGSSFLYKAYRMRDTINTDAIANDVDALIEVYKQQFGDDSPTPEFVDQPSLFNEPQSFPKKDEAKDDKPEVSKPLTKDLTSKLAEYRDMFFRLGTAQSSGKKAPHKAIYLITLIDLIGEGVIKQHRFHMADAIENRFKANWQRYVSHEYFTPNMWQPAFYLKSEPFYRIVLHPSKKLSKPSSVVSFNNTFEWIELDADLFEILQDPKARAFFRVLLITTFMA